MIELPDGVAPSSAAVTLMDFGLTIRPALGGPVSRVGRKGSRYKVEFGFPPLLPNVARRVISRLQEAQRVGGLRIAFPLLGVSQGIPGTPVVDGAGQAGTALAVRGLTPFYAFKEGYWFNAVDAAGQPYLHNVRAAGTAGADGKATLTIEPPLRTPFADGAAILLARPVIEGIVEGFTHSLDGDRRVRFAITIEEAG